MLITDSIGRGKTLETGVPMSQLIRRRKGKRILVLAVKSMLTLLQKDMRSRFFNIAYTFIFSGIKCVRNKIL
jgi:hypothetical protein